MKNKMWTLGFSIVLAGSVMAGSAHDDASDPAYADGWQNYDNGGYGFGAWVMGYWATNGVDRIGIGSATNNGGWYATNNIDTSARSFRIMNADGTSGYIEVLRYLNTDLEAGQNFSFDFDVNWRNGWKGLRVRGEDDSTPIFLIEVGGDDGTFVDNVDGGRTNIGSAHSDDTQYHVVLEQTSAAGGTWTATRTGGITDSDTGTYAGKMSSIQLFSDGVSSDQWSDIYFNNFDVSYTPGFDHYAAWTNQYNLSGADAAMDADPDGDTMKNLLEFSVGRNPTYDEGGYRAPEFLGNSTQGLVYVYTRYNDEVAAAYGLDYSLVLADNLTAAWETNGFVELPPVHLWGDLVTVTNYVPTTDPAAFATLRVESL
ncbi:hypothetical protein PDESU_03601 [Pontiella desulfatans]|uniref:Uncharacterized protein n=2 Tax=Pontiella desulfatans TaxID=2750659 RepID=A0A6C2U671_PONDE|nr:hypothetical protein PDESU_03601 [Pontiella desulfatans]